jgi:hypothetical protein
MLPLGLVEREAARDQAVRFDFLIAISTTVGAVAIGLLQAIAIGVGLSPPGSCRRPSVVPMVRHGVWPIGPPCIPAHGTLTRGFEMDVENHVLAGGTKVTHR